MYKDRVHVLGLGKDLIVLRLGIDLLILRLGSPCIRISYSRRHVLRLVIAAYMY